MKMVDQKCCIGEKNREKCDCCMIWSMCEWRENQVTSNNGRTGEMRTDVVCIFIFNTNVSHKGKV